MIKHYPFVFTLESGTHVEINKTSGDTYEFSLQPKHGSPHHFTYKNDNRPKAEVEKTLDFDELNALRAFWEHQEVV